jgi:hypothetical protein
MMRKLLLLAAIGMMAHGGATPKGPTGQTREEVMAVIEPGERGEAWLEIPWETDLTVARRKAAAAGKPVFLWEMDGHPLGCT